MDESAYISQSFYADLFLARDFDNPAWLDYAGYDLPPLPKYLIGLAIRAEGYRRPGPAAMRAWYADTHRTFVPDGALVAARVPSVILGAVGCLAIFALGTLAFDRRVGYLAALLLMANPLYRLHARRAMSDVPAEALILATLALGLWGWKRLLASWPSPAKGRPGSSWKSAWIYAASGFLCGLATLSKLNGALGGFVLAAWAGLAILLRPLGDRGAVKIVVLTSSALPVALFTFCWLNPFLTAHPTAPLNPGVMAISRLSLAERLKLVAEHRATVSISAKSMFPNDALRTPGEKIEAMAVQGFGRFGPLGPSGRTDSTIRFDRRQDWGAWAWLPWVGFGFVATLARGRDQLRAGEPPAAWAIAAQATVALVTVTAFIPLAWDRYYLSIQPGSALLGAAAAVWVIDLGRWSLSRGRDS